MTGQEPLWQPPPDARASSRIGHYMDWLQVTRGVDLPDYDTLWRWSTTELEAFWTSLWDYFAVLHEQPSDGPACRLDTVQGARWFPGTRVNYTQNVLRLPGRGPDDVVVEAHSAILPPRTITVGVLRAEVARVAAGLRGMGVAPGEVVAAYLPNIPETVILLLACAAIGAVFTSCAPEFGPIAVRDRWSQTEPVVLVAVDRCQVGGQLVSRAEELRHIRASLPSLRHTISVPYPDSAIDGAVPWDKMPGGARGLEYHPTRFDDPLYVLYSSGTTGLPKALVHGHGGILLEHLKVLAFHHDLGPGDRFLWTTSTGWMMWNYLVSGLATGSGIVLYDGDPFGLDPHAVWRTAAATRTTHLGISTAVLQAMRRVGVIPKEAADLTALRELGSGGSPLSPETCRWVYEAVAPDNHRPLRLASVSGGTDLCTAFLAGSPLLPVYAGEISCRCLGAAADSYSADGRPVRGKRGELVLTRPMPSMPLGLWGDANGRRYDAAYFAHFPGVWRHGDWVTVTERGSCVISGRSDATLNRAGIRMGTAEFYAALEDEPAVTDSLVVHLSPAGSQEGELLLFVTLAPEHTLDSKLRARIVRRLRASLSPAHVPDRIHAVPAIPRTLSGKKVEVPVKRLLEGSPLQEVLAPEALAAPDALIAFQEIAALYRRQAAPRGTQ
ncbi:acetoacetate--CoA ligase [Streptomyces wedmorensis]|uniref:acetoacetate--CoA ligase n=1 Tax=Streptomyces wedmorensis TaxID=43759 RepID=UPI0037B4F402